MPPVSPAWERRGTLYVVGIDGMTLDVINPMVARGDLPNLERLAAEGCHGPLKTASPTNSSLLWTSIATGRHHLDHGVDDFRYYRVLGKDLSYTALRKGNRLRKRSVQLLRKLGLAPLRLFDGRSIRAKTFWDVVSEAGGRIGVVNWWHTWPASQVNGFVVSDRLLYWRDAMASDRAPARTRLTFPEHLLDEVRKLVVTPAEVSVQDISRFVHLPDDELREFAAADFKLNELRGELRFFISADRSCQRVLDHCLDAFPDRQLAAVYFRSPDIAQHCAFQYTTWAQAPEVSAEEHAKFGEAVPQAYRLADESLGRIFARLGPHDTLLVLSDHGFGLLDERRGYGHRYGEPPGVLYAYGREFRRGAEIHGGSIYDVAPTVLRLCGFPPARDMEGRSLEDLLTQEFLREHPPLEPVDTYGPRQMALGAAEQPREVTRDIEEHLRGLGYLE